MRKDEPHSAAVGDQEAGKSQKQKSWGRLRKFVMSRQKGKKARYGADRLPEEAEAKPFRAKSRRGDYPGSLRWDQSLFQGPRNENDVVGPAETPSDKAPKSIGRLKKAKTFTLQWGRKGRSPYNDVTRDTAEEPSVTFDACEQHESSTDKDGSSSSQTRTTHGHKTSTSSGNHGPTSQVDLPPSSPLSYEEVIDSVETGVQESPQPSHSGVGLIRSRAGRENENVQQENTYASTSSKGASMEAKNPPDPEHVAFVTRSAGSQTMPGTHQSIWNVRQASIFIEDQDSIATLPEVSTTPATRLGRRSSSMPKDIGRGPRKSKRMHTKPEINGFAVDRNDFESPWGVKASDEKVAALDNKVASRTFRMSDIVHGLKARRSSQSSDTFSLSDDGDDPTANVPIDMLHDEFVDFTVKRMQKDKARAGRKSVVQIF